MRIIFYLSFIALLAVCLAKRGNTFRKAGGKSTERQRKEKSDKRVSKRLPDEAEYASDISFPLENTSAQKKRQQRSQFDNKGNNDSYEETTEEKKREKKSVKSKANRNPSSGRLQKKKRRNVILPQKKVHITEKALKGFELLTRSLKSSADAALQSTQRIKRDLKSYFSSDFEVLLLRLTKPDDVRPSKDDIERVLATVASFIRNVDMTSEDNPYRITLRKIWTKIAECDARTTLKALSVLHQLLKASDPEDSMIFRKLLSGMAKEYCPKTESVYFDTRRACDVTGEGAHLQRLVRGYTAYVFKRGNTFTSGFEEMKLIAHSMRTEDICAQMVKAQKLLSIALDCKLDSSEESEVSVLCLELIARDMRELFLIYHDKLRWIFNEEEIGDLFDGWDAEEVRGITARFKSFYNERFDDIQKYLIDVGDCLELYRIKIPTSLEIPPIFEGIRTAPGSSNASPMASFSHSPQKTSSQSPNIESGSSPGDSAKKSKVNMTSDRNTDLEGPNLPSSSRHSGNDHAIDYPTIIDIDPSTSSSDDD